MVTYAEIQSLHWLVVSEKTGVKPGPNTDEVIGWLIRFLLGDLNHRYRQRIQKLVKQTEVEMDMGINEQKKSIT